MTIRFCALALTALVSQLVSAQDTGIPALLLDDSLLKQQMLDITLKKKDKALASVGKQYAKDYRDIYNRQFGTITETWKSSRPVTEPRAHQFLQSVMGKITTGNEELRNTDARVVFTRDWWPNAVSMGDGTILVNAGLVTGLDNEAELAFVICHELAHYYLEHTTKSIAKLVATQNSEEFKAELKRLSKEQYRVNAQYNDLLKTISFDSRRHSREHETEADQLAFRFMKNSGYDCNAMRTCLEKLDHIDDSLLAARVPVNSVFNFTGYPFNNRWVREESSIFSGMKQETSLKTQAERDSLKTHPACEHRIAMLADSIRAVSPAGNGFQVDETYFARLKCQFALEIMEQCYTNENLGLNLYFAITRLNANADDPMAVYNISRALNDLYTLQRDHKMGKYIDSEDRSNPKDYNQLLRMFSRIKLDELGELAWFFARQHEPFMKQYPGYNELVQAAKANRGK
ncbi:MAG: hypothetical protein EOO09_06200 [Chitinophagaceae bacterium]|nr:MAG: hypothetical protein EOO09_06200 [Chitinophagaceae bacterium]